ncbi:MAG: LytTR family DNA-binding domain-containing protein [Eubacteriales bacterium]
MKINVKIDESIKEDVVDFHVGKLTSKIQKAIDYLHEEEPDVLIGYRKEEIALIKPQEIVLIYTEGKKVFVRLLNGEKYYLKERLYELEESYKGMGFIRIANSSIANGKLIRKLKMDGDGSLSVVFKDGTAEFASRRSVKNIKEYLGIGV